MKKLLLIAIVPFVFMACEKVSVLPMADVPEEITNYVNTHFPNNPIIQVIKDVDGVELTYDVTLEGSFFLEFNRRKEVIEIKGLTELPNSVIPDKILEFVQTQYPENYILKWDLDDKSQEVTLDNELELVFNLKGEFLRIDN